MKHRLAAALLAILVLSQCPLARAAPDEATQGVVKISKEVSSEVRYSPDGRVTAHTLSVRLTLASEADGTTSVTLTDRVFGADLETLSVSGPTPETSRLGGITYLIWRDLEVPSRSERSISYSLETSLPPPVDASLSYEVNGEPAEPVEFEGARYLLARRGDSVRVSLKLRNRMSGFVDGRILYTPLSAIATLQVDSGVLENVSLDPAPLGAFEVGRARFYVMAAGLTNESPVNIYLKAEVRPDADVGVVRLSPVSLSLSVMPVGNLTELEGMRDDLLEARNRIVSVREGMAAYFDLLDSMNDTVGNLSELSIALSGLADASDNFTKAISALRSLTDALGTQAGYLIDGMTAMIRYLTIQAYMGGEGENDSETRPDKTIEGLRALRGLAYSMVETVGYLNDTLTAIENGTGREFGKISRLADEINSSLGEIASSLDELSSSSGQIWELIAGLDDQAAEMEERIEELDEAIGAARLRTVLAPPASLGEPEIVKLEVEYNESGGGWELVYLRPPDPLPENLEPLLLILNRRGDGVVISHLGGALERPLNAVSNYEEGTLTILMPRSSDLSNVSSAAGVDIYVDAASPVELDAWVDLILGERGSASYDADISVTQPKLTVEFIPQISPPTEPIPPPSPAPEEVFQVSAWMWYPLLAIPVSVVAVLMLWDRRPREAVPVSEELRDLLERIERMTSELDSGERPEEDSAEGTTAGERRPPEP
ncbi:MAG: hypothetical protein DRO01_01395 [Thermoproteota archaeon]|nr:MAG: hypothetical protein DRO01_01395 [Candidatus Korarchaeota archaeon]